MKVIWKFELTPNITKEVSMPIGANVISADCQGGVPCVWAIVDPGAPREIRQFTVLGTGIPMSLPEDIDLIHIGTGLTQGGAAQFVWHVFELVCIGATKDE